MEKLSLTIFFIFSLLSFNIYAQDGTNDFTFNSGDIGFGSGGGVDNSVFATALQSDGKIIIGGSFNSYNALGGKGIARLNVDGSIDKTFDVGTGVDGVSYVNSIVYTIKIQSDGKIIIGGDFTFYNGTPINHIARLNPDGSLDATFIVGAGADNIIYTSSIQSDGKIIIGGGFSSYNGTAMQCIARLNRDGSLDGTFSVGSGANGFIKTISIQSDGKVIVGGGFTSYNGNPKSNIVRLNTDGSLDGTFNIGTGANFTVWTSAIQNDGKIIIGGRFITYNNVTRNYIARLNADGSLDPAFNIGTGTDYYVYTISLQSDGKVVVGGILTNYNGTSSNHIIRLNQDGSHDLTFNIGTGANLTVNIIAVQPDGKIIVGGDFTYFNGVLKNRITRLNPDGNIDNTFNPARGANDVIQTIAVQGDGKIIIGGTFSVYNGDPTNRIARLNTDGTIDTTFNVGTGANNTVYVSKIQSDGKIIIGGYFTSYNGKACNYIARLNIDGSLDTTFDVGTMVNIPVISAAIQSDGKIIISFSLGYKYIYTPSIARLNPDGSLDSSFDIGTGANYQISSIAIQSDKKIIIGGVFTSYNDTVINSIARLNPSGSLDATFNVGSGANSYVNMVDIQSDGKIIIGGLFTSYNGIQKHSIARLNIDGTLDGTFDIGSGANNYVNPIALQSDGKIIIGGAFTSYNGTAINHLARLNPDGSLDGTFNVGTGTNGDISTIALQSDGKVIIGGSFTAYCGIGRNRIARLNQSVATYISTYPNLSTPGLSIFPNPNNGDFTISLNQQETFSIVNSLGQIVEVIELNQSNSNSVTIRDLEGGVYFLLSNSNNSRKYKVIVIK